jgi:hypothetical protein
MPGPHLLRTLVPDSPLHKRTEKDLYPDAATELRAKSSILLRPRAPGLASPRLTSSYEGSIDKILFAFPRYAANAALAAGYKSVIAALRSGTEFVVVHAKSLRPEIDGWFTSAGHSIGKVTFVELPDYVNFTDWAEDGYVSLSDAASGTSFLMEPWEFPRSGDTLIAEAVQSVTGTKTGQAPLIFQGGNCLIGDDFWLLGKDYFADSVQLVSGQRGPVTIPAGTAPDAFVTQLFTEYADSARRLIVVGTNRPIPLRSFYGTREGDKYFLDIASDGAGTFQPIFHIDMLITLIGRVAGKFEVLVGSPAMADSLLGRSSPFGLNDVYDTIEQQLTREGFTVRRNPLVHQPTEGQRFTVNQLRELAQRPGNEELGPAVDELVAAGAGGNTQVTVRIWHHITWNNCLVENSATTGKHVYLPTFGYASRSNLKVIDDEMKRLWATLGFTVHALGDFNAFAERQGVVHCIKKYLQRGE